MTPAIPKSEYSKITKELQVITAPLTRGVQSLAVVDADSFSRADSLLNKINIARKTLKERVSGMLDPLDRAKKEIESSRKEITRFRDDLDAPLIQAESTVRELMEDYRREERRLLIEAENKRLEEQRRIDREAEEARLKAEQAKTPQARKMLEKKAEDLEVKSDRIQAQRTPEPIKVAHSSDRVVKKIRVTDLKKLMLGIAKDEVVEDVIDLEALQTRLNKYLRIDEALVKTWPGVEVYEDVQIVRARGL